MKWVQLVVVVVPCRALARAWIINWGPRLATKSGVQADIWWLFGWFLRICTNSSCTNFYMYVFQI